jgi:PAS domain S-box-containing protein
MNLPVRYEASLTNSGRYSLLANIQLDPHGRVAIWNSGAEKLMGYLSDEIIGRDFSIFYIADDQAHCAPKDALEIAAREGRFEAEGRRLRKAGDVFWAHVVLDAIRDPDGRLLGFSEVTRDLTMAREADLAIAGAQSALLQSQKLEAIGHLTGGIAHDFNNLLTVILGGLEIIQRRLPEDQNVASLLTNAIRAAHRGRSLTQRMLAFSSRQDLKPKAINLPAFVGGMADLLQRTLGPSVTVETDIPPDLPAVLADPNQLELAVLNLAINARDALPDGGYITIAATRALVSDQSVSGHYPECVCLAVIDFGGGMDAATLLRATEPFFSTKERGKGVGLGLSMVHGFAEQSAGHLFLKSEPEEGTVAELWLPIALDDPAQSMTAESVDRSTRSHSEYDDGLQPVVLVVDNDRLALMNTAAMLNELGYRVYTATSGNRALGLIRKEKVPDLIVIDHSMPDMNGLELAELVQAEWPKMRIIFATPLADPTIQIVPKSSLQQHLEAAIARAR